MTLKLRKDDQVFVISGKDKGKNGKVLGVYPGEKRILVEGINFIKKHTRRTREGEQQGVIQKESPVAISNVMFLCRHCNKPTRVGFKKLLDNSKTRFCKKCKEAIEYDSKTPR